MRHQAFLTDTPVGEGSLQYLEVRHRAHARVEDRIRCGKTTGFGRFPSRHFAINHAWLELALTAIDLLAWTQTLLLDGELATAEPKKLRYRLLHAAARLTRGGRRLRLRIAATWPWRHELTAAFTRLVGPAQTGHLTYETSPCPPTTRGPLEHPAQRRAKAMPTSHKRPDDHRKEAITQLSRPQPKHGG